MVKHPQGASALIRFDFENSPVRTVQRDGEAWFVLNDVTEALGFSRGRDAARMLDDDEKGAHIVRTSGGGQELIIVSESGLFSLILKSRRPSAKRFKRWVTHEVLPAIRRQGRYEHPGAASSAPSDPAAALLGVLTGSPTRSGRFLLTVEDGRLVSLRDISGLSLVEHEGVEAIRRDLRAMAERLQVLTGEADAKILETPLFPTGEAIWSAPTTDDDRDKILAVIERAGPSGITQRALVRYCRPFRRLSSEQRENLIGSLLSEGAVVQRPSKSGRTRYLIHGRHVMKGLPK